MNKPLKQVAWSLVLLVLLLCWLFWTVDQANTTQTMPNQVTYQTTEQLRSNTVTSDNSEPSHLIEPNHSFTPQDRSPAVGDDLSYLQLYRMHRRWQTCGDVSHYLEQGDEAYHPLNQLQLKINSHHSEQDTWPTAEQVESVQRHTKRCTQLLRQITELKLPELAFDQMLSRHHRLDAQLFEHLKNAQPKTKKEQAIAHVLELISTWQEAFYLVIQTPQSQPLTQQQSTPAYLTDMPAIKQQEDTLNNINAAIQDFSTIHDLLSQQLYSADPDVFYQAQNTLEQAIDINTFGYFPFKNIGQIKNENLISAYISPAEVLMQMAGLQDSEWFDLVIQHATQLYLCELGADCGPDSHLISHYCHAGLLVLDPVSCALDYPTFLQSHYLNDNQWHDVQYILSLIRGLYAQN